MALKPDLTNSLVADWFGDDFYELDPLLQRLHLYGGELSGDVDLALGTGLARLIGQRLAKKLGLPTQANSYPLKVSISYEKGMLRWARQFNQTQWMISYFIPKGTRADGYWFEKTGALELHLGVNIQSGGWYWQPRRIKFMGLPLPLWLFPTSQAYKRIIDGKYEFLVAFSLPVLGELLSYRGLLELNTDDT